MQYVVIGLDGTDKDAPVRRQAARADHINRGEELLAAGNIWYGAALLNNDGSTKGSIYIVSFKSEPAMQEWLDNEPYITGQVWQDITVYKSNTRDPWQYCHPREWYER